MHDRSPLAVADAIVLLSQRTGSTFRLASPNAYRARFRALSKWLRGKGVFFLRELKVPTEYHGSPRHGWTVFPRSLSAGSVVYSFGVGSNISFDLSLIQRHGMRIHAFDPTPGVQQWLREQRLPPEFQYHSFALADQDGTAQFFPPPPGRKCHTLQPRELDQVSGFTVPTRRLSTIMQSLGHDQIDLLKIDIEGAEYGVIDDLIKSEIPVRQLLVEFHHRFPTIGPAKTRRAIALLRQHGFRIFAVSPSCNEYGLLNVRLVDPALAAA